MKQENQAYKYHMGYISGKGNSMCKDPETGIYLVWPRYQKKSSMIQPMNAWKNGRGLSSRHSPKKAFLHNLISAPADLSCPSLLLREDAEVCLLRQSCYWSAQDCITNHSACSCKAGRSKMSRPTLTKASQHSILVPHENPALSLSLWSPNDALMFLSTSWSMH